MGDLNRIGDAASVINPGSEYTGEELEFMLALDKYKRVNRRPYPSWSEVLNVALSLGYRKVADKVPLPTYRSDGRDGKRQHRRLEEAL